MAGISDNLEEFRKLSNDYYKGLMESLDEKYCWKCPMRTNRSESFCREVDSWIRLSGAFEMGIHDALRELGIPNRCIEVIASKNLGKKMKLNRHQKTKKLIFLEINPDIVEGSDNRNFALIKESPARLKIGDMILLPKACPLATYWFTKTDFGDDMPLKMYKVERVFDRHGVKYIKTEDGLEIPIEFVYGLVLKIVTENDPVFSELRLSEI